MLDEATKYLRKYKGINEYILKHGTTYPVSSLITYLYMFRILESFGYDLEDIFMEVYVSILDVSANDKSLQNMPYFIKRKIMDCIKGDFIDATGNKLMKMDIADFEFLEIRKEEYDLNKEEEIDNTFELCIENFTDREVIEYMFNEAHLRDVERHALIKYYYEEKTLSQLSKELNHSNSYGPYILEKSLRKIRSRFLKSKNDILYPRE